MAASKIVDGDVLLLYLSRRKTFLVKAEKGKAFHTHKGIVSFDNLIGREYGSRVTSSLGTEFIALHPMLSDYIFKSTRRTQITYPKDAALIVMFSGIGPSSRVVEAGAGTGALTTALAHYVRPHGKVYSYELRGEFINTAMKNLQRAGLLTFVELKNKDVTMGIDEKEIDAVILDLASPWAVAEHAYTSLKPSGSIVSFSPTIDQVVKMAEALAENSFTDVRSYECLLREMQVVRGKTRPETLMTGHTGYITFARKATRPQP